MFTKRKKIILLSAMVVLLVLTAVLNVALNKNFTDTGAGSQTSAGFFATYKEDREYARNQELVVLNAILADPTTSAELKAKAESDKLKLVSNIELELVCEGLIKSLGFNDAIITTGNNFYNVVVNKDFLTGTEVAMIAEIVQTKANTALDNIIVSWIE